MAKGGGNQKFIILGVLLLGGATGLWMMLQAPAAPPAAPPEPPKPAKVEERVNPMAQPELILEEEKDAGKPPEPVAEDKPKVKHGSGRSEWDCQGELTRAAIQEVINANRAQIRNCYERRLKVNNVLQGDLRLKFKVGSAGRTTAAAVSGSLRDNEVFGCVRSIAQKWSFPPPTGGDCAVAEVPFQFSPKSN